MFTSVTFHLAFLRGRERGGVITSTQGSAHDPKCKKFMLKPIVLLQLSQ